jgi:lysophospholipase L1-like esterase
MKYIFLLIFISTSGYTQNITYKWYDPINQSNPVINGRGWKAGFLSPFDRLPEHAKPMVRGELWNLSKHSSGQYINFKTRSSSIIVKYQVKGTKSQNQMPATGVSGVDIYAKGIDGNWRWTRGIFKFGDTIEYRFENIMHEDAIEHFRLYLPLYNEVTWMTIGIPDAAEFHFIPFSTEKPVVAYGTSIMHGAYASRPGLAWTNILGRKLNKPTVNLGFSGNGQLEKPMIALINEIDASVFILDCMPNLHDQSRFTSEEIEKRMRYAVEALQHDHPDVPIVFAEHCSGLEGVNMDAVLVKKYMDVSRTAASIFQKMKSEGIKGIHHLSALAIGFDAESTMDGTHPNDIGMMKYANAYYNLIMPLISKKD